MNEEDESFVDNALFIKNVLPKRGQPQLIIKLKIFMHIKKKSLRREKDLFITYQNLIRL